MAVIHTVYYQGEGYPCRENETILDAMIRQGVEFPFSCRSGSCHVCMHRIESGRIPSQAQKGLSPEQRAQGLFLPCCCRPLEDMVITPLDKSESESEAADPDVRTRPEPDMEMWRALDEGRLLTRILDDFYSRVFEDERLAPFFDGVTRQRAKEKQFLFLRQMFTGEKVYFGDRPRNAHHWMVISNDLFDYREGILLDTLRSNGLPEHLVTRWRDMEERFRSDIVKDTPWKKKMGGVELPVEGYGETVMDIGSLCDGCGEEIDAGVSVRYHLRLGTIYCPSCMSPTGD